jgi:hypothetical protein
MVSLCYLIGVCMVFMGEQMADYKIAKSIRLSK